MTDFAVVSNDALPVSLLGDGKVPQYNILPNEAKLYERRAMRRRKDTTMRM